MFDKKAFIDDLTAHNLAVFPLRWDEDINERKKPAIKQWQDSLPIENDNTLDRYGIALTDEWIVVDHDAYKSEARDSFDNLGIDDNTFTVQSGRGGRHYFYKNPTKQPIYKKLQAFPGIEFLSVGMYVVGAGTDTYHVITGSSLSDAIEAPTALLERLNKQTIPTVCVEVDKSNIEGYLGWLDTQPGAIQGQGGDDLTYKIIARARDFGVPQSELLEILEPWNEKCEPAWSEDELNVKIINAYKYGQNSLGSMVADTALFETILEEPEATKIVMDAIPLDFWDQDLKGRLRPTARNLKALFGLEVFGTVNHPDINFTDLFRYNEFTKNTEFTRKPFWRAKNDKSALFLADSDLLAIKMFFIDACRVEFEIKTIVEVINFHAFKASYHPIRLYLANLEWDGIIRLSDLFTRAFNFKSPNEEDLIFRQHCGQALILAAIERIMNPGCKWDNAFILAGPQGVGKSMFVEAIGGEWTTTLYHLNTDKDSMMAVASSWFIELPELSAVKKADVSQIKAFLSVKTDTFRMPYGHCIGHADRQCVFVWTLNPSRDNTFLTDETGGRRFWILDTPHEIDLDWIKENREQLFAEGMALYNQGIRAYQLLDEVKETGTKYVEEKTVDYYDPINQKIIQYLHNNWDTLEDFAGQKRIGYIQLFEALGVFDPHKQDQAFKRRIGRIMDELGWTRYRTNEERFFVKDYYDI